MLGVVFADGIWRRNVVWVQLLGLCPLLAVSNTIQNAIGLSVASSGVLIASSIVIAAIRKAIPQHSRLPCFVLVIATFTTIASLLLEAYAWDWYMRVALFVQIIVTNCMILSRIEQVASKNSIFVALMDAVATSIGFTISLLILGTTRELLEKVLPLAAHPAGAFIIAGLLIGAYQWITGEPRKTNSDIRTSAHKQSQTNHGT